VESFFGTLKKERIHDRGYLTPEKAKQAVFEYIGVYYNRQPGHSTLGSRSPAEFEPPTEVP